jgi:uncharacterized protein
MRLKPVSLMQLSYWPWSLIALARGSRSLNFVWFVQRGGSFVYVDRIVVSAAARGQGIARAFYEELFAAAAQAGFDEVTCEVNSDPPNPISDKFHATLGFLPVGSATLPNGKTVTYLSRPLKETKL